MPTATFNDSGTHVKNGRLKVRFDLHCGQGSQTYPLHYVDHFDREPTEAELADEAKLALIPTHKELNPCLCHFVTIDPETTREELEAKVRQIFDAGTVSQLDNLLSDVEWLEATRWQVKEASLRQAVQLMNSSQKRGGWWTSPGIYRHRTTN
jgi:myo-inositol catabolism protein IolC